MRIGFKCMKYVSMNESIQWHPWRYNQYITQSLLNHLQHSMKSLMCAFFAGVYRFILYEHMMTQRTECI